MTSHRHVCTIIARNYWAHARVLANSLRKSDPDAELTVLVVDGDARTIDAAKREAFEVVCPASLGLSSDEINRMAAIYDVMEFSTALKPWLMRSLLERGATSVVYLDPDIEVFAPLIDAWDLAVSHGIVLTPHTLAPLPHDNREPSELTILNSGIYNLGFIALGASSEPFIDWWQQRLRRNALIAKPEGMFVDQRWVDLVPTYFDPHVVRDPGWNVAYWNLPLRDVARKDDSYVVDGSPLMFFHFSGFDPYSPDVLSKFQGHDPRVTLDRFPVVAELCARYADELLDAGYEPHSRAPYAFARSTDGVPLAHAVRYVYRRELLKAEESGDPEPPNPFDADEYREFLPWLLEVVGYKEHVDVPGVNVAGYVNAESGVGECARMLIRALDVAGVQRSVVGFDATESRQEAGFATDTSADHPVNIVCVNADQFPNFVSQHEELFDDRYTIGVWNWEVERLPDDMAASAQLADEIWVASEHTAKAVRAATNKPVFVFPIPVVREMPAARSRADLGLPEGFAFLFCFDFDSVFERKNPIAAIEAFTRAFAPNEGPKLVIKSVRGDVHPKDLERLRAAASSRPDVFIVDGYLPSDEQHALMASADAYVSLHRAEGFGLTIAEAMALGKPVIATGYSGNLGFMDETNSWLVDFEMVTIGPGSDPYPADARWAEPDVDAAAKAMREVYTDPGDRGERAAFDVARLNGPAARAPFILDRLEAIATLEPKPLPPEPEPFKEPLGLQPQHSSPALAEIRALLEAGPDVEAPTRYPRLSRRLRAFVLRATQHRDEHGAKVAEAFIAAIEERRAFESEVREEMRKLYRTEHRADVLERRDGELQAALEEMTARLRKLEARLRQERRLRRELAERLQQLGG